MALAELVATVSDTALTVTISEEITEGLERHQVEAMQQTIDDINVGTAGYHVICAKKLYDLRNTIKGNKKNDPRQWSKFKKSGLVPFKARDITDLITFWEGWASNTSLPPNKFNVMGIRTLFEVGTAIPSVQKKVENMLLAGQRVTQRDVQELKGNKAKASKGKGAAKAIRGLVEAKQRIEELEDENAQLRAALAKAKVKYSVTTSAAKKSKIKA